MVSGNMITSLYRSVKNLYSTPRESRQTVIGDVANPPRSSNIIDSGSSTSIASSSSGGVNERGTSTGGRSLRKNLRKLFKDGARRNRLGSSGDSHSASDAVSSSANGSVSSFHNVEAVHTDAALGRNRGLRAAALGDQERPALSSSSSADLGISSEGRAVIRARADRARAREGRAQDFGAAAFEAPPEYQRIEGADEGDELLPPRYEARAPGLPSYDATIRQDIRNEERVQEQHRTRGSLLSAWLDRRREREEVARQRRMQRERAEAYVRQDRQRAAGWLGLDRDMDDLLLAWATTVL